MRKTTFIAVSLLAAVAIVACSDSAEVSGSDIDGGSTVPGADAGKVPGTDGGATDASTSPDAADASASADAADAAIPTYAVGGTVTGLPGGGSVTLKNNGADDVTRSADGTYSFPTKLKGGAGYDVTVSAFPAGHTCTVANGKSTVAAADVTNANVTCKKIPGSCREIKLANAAAPDGVYAIYTAATKLDVYCDMTTDGGGWTKILQYHDAAYTPTAAAAGAIAVAGTAAFAKLSDAQINAIGGAGAAKTYRFTGAKSTKKLFLQTATTFDDTARAMNLTGAVDACEADSFDACAPTAQNQGTIDSLAMGLVGNDEHRYFTDYSGVAECYPTTGANARCFNAGNSTGHVRIDDFALWLREGANLPTPTAHWKLDANAGTTFADASGHGYTATATPGAWVAGHAGSAYSGKAEMDADLPAFSAFTISLWVKREALSPGGAFPRFISFPSDVFELAEEKSTTKLSFYSPSTGWQITNTLLTNVYTHVVASVGAGSIRLYVDGVPTNSYGGTATIVGKMMFDERSNSGGEPFNGAYDDVRIYDRAIWPAEVSALFNP